MGFLANVHGNGRTRVYQNSTHSQLTPPRTKTVARIRINFTQPETRVAGKHFRCWQYGSIFIHFFIVVVESEAEKSSQTDDENFRVKWLSKAFKVKHFRVAAKLIRHFMTLRNNIGLNSESSEHVATKITKNYRFWPPYCLLRPLVTEPLWISARAIYRMKAESLGYILAADSMGLSSLKFLWWAPKDASFCALECDTAVQGHPRSLILVAIERTYIRDFLLVINSNLGPISHRFWDTATYWLKIENIPYSAMVYRPRLGWRNFEKSFTDPSSRVLRGPTVKISWS